MISEDIRELIGSLVLTIEKDSADEISIRQGNHAYKRLEMVAECCAMSKPPIDPTPHIMRHVKIMRGQRNRIEAPNKDAIIAEISRSMQSTLMDSSTGRQEKKTLVKLVQGNQDY